MRSTGANARRLPYSFPMARIGSPKGDCEGVIFSVPGVVLVNWDPALKAICLEWQSWASSAEFAAALDAGLNCLAQHRGTRWLADCLDMKAVKQSDQEWLDRNWFPRALALGLRRVAVVNPKSGLSKMNLDDIFGRVPATKLDVAYFATVAEGKEWLNRPFINTPRSLEALPA